MTVHNLLQPFAIVTARFARWRYRNLGLKLLFSTASFTLFSFLGRQFKIVVDNQNIHVDCPADNLHFEPYFQPCIESIDPLFPYHVIVIEKYYCT